MSSLGHIYFISIHMSTLGYFYFKAKLMRRVFYPVFSYQENERKKTQVAIKQNVCDMQNKE